MSEFSPCRRRILLTAISMPAVSLVACTRGVISGEQDSTNTEDIKRINEIINSLQSTTDESLGKLYDTRIYPEAFLLAQAAIKSPSNVVWKKLFAQLYVACRNLNDEGLFDLLTEIQGAEQAQVESKAFTPTPAPPTISITSLLPPELRDEYLYADYEEYLSRVFDKGAPVAIDGCDIVVSASQERASHSNNPILFGTIFIKNVSGSWISYNATTGGSAPSFTRRGGPLPPGRYYVNNYRPNRSDVPAMMVDGVSYSFDVLPEKSTNVYGRSLFRIHPDGRLPGTLGCIGITGKNATKQKECELILRDLVHQSKNVKLAMTNYSIDPDSLK